MANLNTKAAQQNTYDAIVIGSGISGGWAAKELCEKGLKTLVLERGRAVVHGKDYPTATKAPWEMPHHGKIAESVLEENPVIAKCYAFDEFTEHFFVKDKEHPYTQEEALRLDSRLPGGRQVAAVGAANPALERF